LSRPIMARSRRESHQRNGITDPKSLQPSFATKSAQSGHHVRAKPCPLLGLKRTSGERALVSGYYSQPADID
jgi:hypothetical protein